MMPSPVIPAGVSGNPGSVIFTDKGFVAARSYRAASFPLSGHRAGMPSCTLDARPLFRSRGCLESGVFRLRLSVAYEGAPRRRDKCVATDVSKGAGRTRERHGNMKRRCPT